MADSVVKKDLGDMLVEIGMITADQLSNARVIERESKRKLADVLVEQGVVTSEDIAMGLSLQLNMPFIDLKLHTVQPNALRMVPEKTARKYKLIPLDIVGDSLVVVMANPMDIRAIEDVATQAQARIQPAVGVPEDIVEAIDLGYRAHEEIVRQVSRMAPAVSIGKAAVDTSSDVLAKTPVVRTVDLIISQALRERASDIHIEPQESRLRIRFRVDGVLHDAMSLPSNTLAPLISRIKIMAGMDITEQRRPQDGQCSVKIEGKQADIRVATYETTYGETMVMRLLDKSMPLFTLKELGFQPEALKQYENMLKSPFGMILTSGPTGAGKTTTLYSSLNQLDRNQNNIMTIEDPVEYHFMDIKQTQTNPKAGITFANGLRAMMRLDPDIILVGEIRDQDTTQMAIQAALTGHLVLSTIHANDAIGALLRLIDLGAEKFLVASAVVGMIAQRMLRRICPHCTEPYAPSTEERAFYEREMGSSKDVAFSRGAGCNLCTDTGYLGRTGVFEVLALSEKNRDMMLKGASTLDLKAQAVKEGLITLRHDGMIKVQQGITTIAEVQRNVFAIG